MDLEGPVIQQVKSYAAMEAENNTVRHMEPVVGAKDKGKEKAIGVTIREPTKVIQIQDTMTPSDVELERK